MRRGLILAEVARGARLDRNFMLLVALSASIAMIGMLMNSTVVVIGAMLVSPLMGPIMGISFGLATLDNTLIRRGVVTLLAGMAVAILISAAIAFVSPIQDVTTEISNRTRPSLFDLAIAVVGGIAAVFAIVRHNGGVMVGVAIATTLMPPLSTIGFGLVTGRPEMGIGASLLFLTNAFAIAFTATVMARVNKFGPSRAVRTLIVSSMGILAVLGVLAIPLGLTLSTIAYEVRARTVVRTQLDTMLQAGDRLDSLSVRSQDGRLVIDGVLLVANYHGDVNARLSRDVSRSVNKPVDSNLVQLRQERGSSEEQADSINRRLAALEQRSAESDGILKALTVGGLIERDRVLVDPQARTVIVARNRAQEGEAVATAIDRVVASVQLNYPTWLIRQAAWLTLPQANTDASQADTPR